MKNETNPIQLDFHLQGFSRYQKELPSRKTVKRWVEKALISDGEILIRFVDAEEGLELNAQYRGKDYATNVLTFDYQHEPTVEADIVICIPVLEREAKEQNKTLKEHLAHLIVHGVLHAQGYDHMTDEEAEEMEQLETDILCSLGFDLPYPDRNYQPRKL